MSLKPVCNAHGSTSIPSQLEYHQSHAARCAKAAREIGQALSVLREERHFIGGMRRLAVHKNRMRKRAAFHFHVARRLAA